MLCAVLKTTGGTAQFGEDYIYTPRGRTLQFPAGETSVAVIIEIVDDELVEREETIELVLSGAQHGSLGNPSYAMVYIDDNDVATERSTVAPKSSENKIGKRVLYTTYIDCCFGY